MDKLCALCNHRVATSRHHLYPREMAARYSHLKDDEEMGRIALLCRGCHAAIHIKLTNRQLFDYYHSIKRLREHPAIQRRLKLMESYPTGYSKSGYNVPQRVTINDIKLPV